MNLIISLILIGFTASLFVGILDSYAFNEGGIVIEVPGQIMDISDNVISLGQTMVVNGTFNQPVDKFTASVFKNYEDSRRLVLTLSPSSNESGDFDFSFAIPDDWELGTYAIILENGLQSMDWKFTVRQNHGGGTLDRTVYPVPWSMSPLKQFEAGILIDDIKCKNYKHVLAERPNGKPACVYYLTAEKLDWKILHIDSNVTPKIFEVLKNKKLFDVEYYIKGGTIQDMIYDVDTNVLLVTVDATNKGSMTIHMPRSLIDAKMDYCPPRNVNASDDTFFVLINGEEVSYDEISTTSKKRTLQIPFIEGIFDIEIIRACLI